VRFRGAEDAPPPDEERTTSPRKVKGSMREGVGGAIKEGAVDDSITVRQGEVAHANVVEAGV
jgi:hypothetical protein